MKRELLIAEFISTPWALMPERLSAMSAVLARWAAGQPAGADVLTQVRADHAAVQARREDAARTGSADNIAVLPCYGVIAQRGNMADDISGPGSTSTQKFGAMLRQVVADPSVGGVLIDFDTPGGSVYGVQELADEILQARAQKPIFGFVNSLCASAGYWLGSACSQLHITPGGEAGSVGVYTVHQDVSKALEEGGVKTTVISAGKYKVEGNPFEPLGDEARAFKQGRIDDYYSAFIHSVAKGRGKPVDAVRGDFGQGRVFGASAAVAAGMADGVCTMDDCVKALSREIRARAKANPKAHSQTSGGRSLATAQRSLAILAG